MKAIKFNYRKELLVLLITLSFLLNPISLVDGLTFKETGDITIDNFDTADWQDGIKDGIDDYLGAGSDYASDFDVGSFLSDNENNYGKIWDPWLTKAAIHAVATTDDGDYMALAGGYLYDDEIHLYRWNYVTEMYDLVSEIGSGVFKSDVLTLAFADSDYNNLTEIVAGSEDGFLYVFEQRHLYDPYTNSENEFDLVWRSKRLGRIFSVIVEDTDLDFRQDIIVGTADTLRFFEYDTHGSYPFGPDHWIKFREVFSHKMPTDITALNTADVDYDGLPEVAVGMRSGEIVLMENNGTSLLINGYYYPIIQDNSYVQIWSSGSATRRSISDISGGDIDDDGHKELLVAVQGQGAYVLDNINNNIGVYRLERPFANWQSKDDEIYPLDYFVDSMVNSSSLFNGSLISPVGATGANVYHTNSVFYGTTKHAEPLNYSITNYKIYPYNTHMSYRSKGYYDDNNYTTFDATSKAAWAVLDFGRHEEAAGNGVHNSNDLIFWVQTSTPATSQFELSISADGDLWYPIDSSEIDKFTNRYEIDVDATLEAANLDYYRYLNVTLLSGSVNIDYIETLYVNNPIHDALSTEVGDLYLKGSSLPTSVGFIATIDGSVLAVDWNPSTKLYEVVWDSWIEERWKLNKNVFDLEMIKQTSRFPAWVKEEADSFTFDLSGTLPSFDPAQAGGEAVSYTVDNFYNYKNERSLEFIVSTSTGELLIYTQASPDAEPIYNPLLTYLLFEMFSSSFIYSVNDYIDLQMIKYPDAKFFTASIVPMNAELSTTGTFSIGDNGYWLFLGQWSGVVGPKAEQVPIGTNDVSVYYLAEGSASCGVAVPHCAFFMPVMDFKAFNVLSLGNTEATGQLKGVFAQSTWMPKISAANFIGGDSEDLILTNGKIHLLETVVSSNPTYGSGNDNINLTDSDSLSKIFGRLETSYVANYFEEINENSKGRAWTNANPVDFDGDGDLDLLLGFARYNETLFGLDKSAMGMTYWENQGSNEDPHWVEMKKAVTNNDISSNFRVQNYTEPVFVYDDYDFGGSFDYVNGYHPVYKTDKPTALFMTQIDPAANSLFKGTVTRFHADYNPPSAFLAATYPEVKRIDINLQNDAGSVNYGYHIFETWDNEEELRDWTLSMSTADLDEDGNNEVIVGDFNNNIFVFEHLTNNSYKRSFKSFDINRTVMASNSPYAHEQFGGIDGTFYRTIYDHVEYLIAGVDLNNNGLQEFIAASADMIFVFEAVYTQTGLIREDTYQLIKKIDILNLPALIDMDQEDRHISALAWGDDLTGEDRRELLVGVGSALFIFEISKDPIQGTSKYSAEEIFYGQAYGKFGLFDSPGNYYMYPHHKINAILVEDLNLDGKWDLVIAGRNEELARPIWSGFITVLEWTGSSFIPVVPDDIFAETVEFNPINDLAVADADLDGLKELVIGHNQGVDIYEFDAESAYQREVITSNPHYQISNRKYKPYAIGAQQNKYLTQWKSVVRVSSTTLKMAYVGNTISGGNVQQSDLIIATSTDNGVTWGSETVIYSYTPITGGSGTVYYQFEDLGFLYDSGTYWLTYVLRSKLSGFADSLSGFIWRNPENPDTVYSFDSFTSTDGGVYMSPRPFSYPGSSSNVVGIAYIDYLNVDNSDSTIKIRQFNYAKGGVGDQIFTPEYANGSYGSNFGDHFYVKSLDITELVTPTGNDFGLIFEGYMYSEVLSLDDDLFYAPLHLNNTAQWLFNATRTTRTFSSGIDVANPSIIQEVDTNNIMITFEQDTLRPYGGLYSIWSNDLGISWQGPFDMSYAIGIENSLVVPFVSPSRETFTIGTLLENIIIRNFESHYPVIAPGYTAGFTMVYNIRYELVDTTKLRFGYCANNQDVMMVAAKERMPACSNPTGIRVENHVTTSNFHSNFTWYKVGGVQDLTVGDSDRDGRSEILVASGKKATLFEFVSNSQTHILHSEVWASKEYDRPLTTVAISDSNGNGMPELIIESDRGIVHSYEVVNPLMGQSDLLYPKYTSKVTDAYTGLGPNSIMQFIQHDANGDEIDDIIFATGLGEIGLIDGKTFNLVYLSTAISATNVGDTTFKPMRLFRDNELLFAYKTTLYLYDLTNGKIKDSILFVKDITANIWQFTLDEKLNIYVALDDGSIRRVNPDSFAVDWEILSLSLINPIDFVSGLNIFKNFLYVTTLYGEYAKIDINSKSRIWQDNSHARYIFTNQALVDINADDNPDLIIVGYNFTVAIDGVSGLQLWNASLPGTNPFTSEIIINDLNNDQIPDIIVLEYYSTRPKPFVYALDSTDGTYIWTEEVATTSGYNHGPDVSSITFGANQIEVVLHSSKLNGKGLTVIRDLSSGIVRGAISSTYEITAQAALLINGKSIIVTGDLNGNVFLYNIYKGQPETRTSISQQQGVEPFLRVGADFTRRTKFLLYDTFSNGDTGKDGIDDIFVVDDKFIGGADTYKLENDPDYNKAVWQYEDKYTGTFDGYAQIVDVTGGGDYLLIASFEHYLIALNPSNGKDVWKYNYHDNDYTENVYHKNFELGDLDSDGIPELVVGMYYIKYGVRYGLVQYFNLKDGSLQGEDTHTGFNNAIVKIADFNGNGDKRIFTVLRNATNPFWTRVAVYKTGMSLDTAIVDIKFMPMVSDVAIGNFDGDANNEDEFIIFFELGSIDWPDILYHFINFPTMFLTLGYQNGVGYEFPSAEVLTFSPYGGRTISHWVYDMYNDGQDDLIGLNRYGDMFSIYGDGSTGLINQDTFTSLSVPYTRNMFEIGTFCSDVSFIYVTSANSVACYDKLDFSIQQVPSKTWNVKIDIIHDIVVGDLDDDALDDFIIASREGFVWIAASNDAFYKLKEMTLDQPQNAIALETNQVLKSVGIAGIIASPFILLAYRMKFKKKIKV